MNAPFLLDSLGLTVAKQDYILFPIACITCNPMKVSSQIGGSSFLSHLKEERNHGFSVFRIVFHKLLKVPFVMPISTWT